MISNIPPLKLRIDFFCNDHLRCPAEENITFSLSWRWVKWESLNLCWPLITCMFSSVPASISDGDMIGLCSPVRIIPPPHSDFEAACIQWSGHFTSKRLPVSTVMEQFFLSYFRFSIQAAGLSGIARCFHSSSRTCLRGSSWEENYRWSVLWLQLQKPQTPLNVTFTHKTFF